MSQRGSITGASKGSEDAMWTVPRESGCWAEMSRPPAVVIEVLGNAGVVSTQEPVEDGGELALRSQLGG